MRNFRDICRFMNISRYGTAREGGDGDLTSLTCFLADRTNGRAYATVLRLSSVCRLRRYVL